MKKIICILLILSLCGCSAPSFPKHSTGKSVYEAFSDMKSYTAKVKVFTYSNTNEGEYEMTQYFSYPGKFRSEGEIGTTVVNGEKAAVSYESPKTKEVFDSLSDDLDFMYLSSFFDRYYRNENASIKSSAKNDRLVTLSVETGIPNKYKSKASLMINTEDMCPVSLSLTDDKGNAYMKINYISFEMNPQLDEKLFEIN